MQALQRDASQDASASQVSTRKHKAREASPSTAADSAAPSTAPLQPPTNATNPSTAAASHSQAGQPTAVDTPPDAEDVSAGVANNHLYNHADQPAAGVKTIETGLVPAATASKQRNLRAAKMTPASEVKLAGVKRRTPARDLTAAGQEEQSQASHAGPKNKRQHTEAKPPVEASTSAEATEMLNKKPRRRTRAASLEAADNQTAHPAVASAVPPAQTDAAVPTVATLPERAALLPGKAVLLTEEVLPEEVAAPEGMAAASDREKRRAARLLKPPAEGKQGQWFELLSRQRHTLLAAASLTRFKNSSLLQTPKQQLYMSCSPRSYPAVPCSLEPQCLACWTLQHALSGLQALCVHSVHINSTSW